MAAVVGGHDLATRTRPAGETTSSAGNPAARASGAYAAASGESSSYSRQLIPCAVSESQKATSAMTVASHGNLLRSAVSSTIKTQDPFSSLTTSDCSSPPNREKSTGCQGKYDPMKNATNANRIGNPVAFGAVVDAVVGCVSQGYFKAHQPSRLPPQWHA